MRKHPYLLALLSLLALGAAALVAFSTWNGPVGFSDTAAYLASGRNLARGIGLGFFQPSGDFEALTVHPPLYALFYTLLHLLGIDLLDGGRWLNLAAVALAVLALGLIFLHHSRVPYLGLLAAAIFTLSPLVIDVFAALMTDGLFLALWLGGMLALFAYLKDPQRKRLVATVLLFGALPLLRYIGLALVLAATLLILFWFTGSLRRRGKQAGIFLGTALAPSLLWTLISYLTLERGLAGRAITLNQIDYSDAITDFSLRVANVLYIWNPFAPASPLETPWPRLLGTVAIAALATWLAYSLARRQRAPSQGLSDVHLFTAFGASGIVFLAGIAGAFLFTSPTPDIIGRTMLPLFACLLVCAFSLAALINTWRPLLGTSLALMGSVLMLAGLVRPVYETLLPLHQGRNGYFTYAWRESELMEHLRSLPEDRPIIASQASIVLYWADRPAHEMLPYLPAGFLDSGNTYGSDPEADRLQAFFRQEGVLVLFNDFPGWLHEPRGPGERSYAAGLTEGLQLVGAYPQGSIYAFDQ